MNPIFIYQNEVALDNNNKFTIDFVDGEIVNLISLSAKKQYYISTLNCNISKANKRKVTFTGTEALANDLSIISRELLDKGSNSKNDIDYVTATLDNYDLPEIAPQKYNIVLDPQVINDNCYRYQFYDNVDKRIKFAKIYSPFSHLKSGIIFKGENDNVKNNKVIFQLVQNYTKIRCIFLQNADEKAKITTRLYRDLNGKFVKEVQRNGTNRWWKTNPSLTLLAQTYQIEDRRNFHVGNFMKEMYFRRGLQGWLNGKYKVIGTGHQRIFNGRTQPFIQGNINVEIKRNEPFFISGAAEKKENKFKSSILNNCEFVSAYTLTAQDKTAINQLYPNFSFKYLSEFVYKGNSRHRFQWGEEDLFVLPSTKADKGNFKNSFMKFVCSKSKYEDYLNSNNGIFYFDSYKDLPDDLAECEKLFDKEVLEIKKLVGDIGELKEITEDEQLNLILYDDSNIIEETFIQRFNKHLQLYGFISIPFANTKKNNLITLDNLLPFRVKRDIQKEKLTFELSYLDKEDQIATNDKKIHNLSIVCIEDSKQMPIIEKEDTIEGLQTFENYQKLNSLDIKITDNEIFKRLIYKENKRIKYRFIPNSILFSSSVQEETQFIFLTVSGLNEARDIFINGKVYKAIGCIFTKEIEGWDKIKKTTSNSVSCKLTNSRYPFGTKHLAFEFDTTSLNTLLNFTLNLIDQTGKEISFLDGEQKVPALNFTIQIIS